MTKRSSILVAVVAAAVATVGIGTAQLAFRNDGIRFPDGTLQTSAAETPGEFVQGAAILTILDLNECVTGDVYSVPVGKRLRIEWLSLQLAEFGGDDFDPVDVDLLTTLGGAEKSHYLDRIDGSQVLGTSFFRTVRWSSPLTVYSQGDKKVRLTACRNNDTDETDIYVRFHGQLFNE